MKRVTTLTGSVYYIDGNEVCRFVGTGANALRKDGENITIVARSGVTLGQPMIFLLSKVSDEPGVYTSRMTTPVVEIEEIDTVTELIDSLRGGGHFLGEQEAS